jgi:hypothetical protein
MTWPRSRVIECAGVFYDVSIVNYIVSLVVCLMDEELWTVRKEAAMSWYVL